MSRLLIIFTVTLISPFILLIDVQAEELDSLRLFYDSLKVEAVVDPSTQPSALPKKSIVRPQANYVYNGYMSSEGGKHFIINGRNLSDIKLLELVLVSDSGRTLKLRTTNGVVFTLAVGEAMSVDLIQARGSNE